MVLKILRHRNQEFTDLAFSYPYPDELTVPMNAQMQPAPLPLSNPLLDGAKLVRSARAVIATEARAIETLHDRVDGRFLRACQLMFECNGRVVVSGMGKSGHIARKIAATLASTGTPSFFVHPGEASHGDLGMITQKDVVLALSNSGETDELLTILPLIKRQGIPLIVMSGNDESSLARLADVHIDTSVPAEACPLGLAPTASTTAALVMGDALAIALLEARGFTDEDFARSHPAGSLGRQLLLKISDVMHAGEQIPTVAPEATLTETLVEMTRKGLGMTAIVDDGGHLLWLQRLDGAAPVSSHIAPAKARTAALGRRESKTYEDMINQGRMSFLSAPTIEGLLEGGVPVMVDGHCVGAVGVSGVKSSEDVQIAKAGIAAVAA